MRILINSRVGGAYGFITDGWQNALRSRGHQVLRWSGDIASWDVFDPDLYIGCSGHKQPIPKDRRAKIAIHVNPYGPINIHGINESEGNIKWVEQQRPDCVFGYGQEHERLYWDFWTTKLGIPWVAMPTAGDSTVFNGSPEDDKVCDIVYLGGRWAYKGITIDEYLLPVIREFSNTVVYGWGEWPSGISRGILEEGKVADFLRSGKIGPCISEKHTQEYGIDIPERAFKVALSGALVIHDFTNSIKRMIKSAIVSTSAADFKDQIKYYLEDDQARIRLAKEQRKEVVNSHTYHHRMANLLTAMGWPNEAADMLA